MEWNKCSSPTQTLQSHTERKLLSLKFYCWEGERQWKRENLLQQSVFWLKRPKFKHLFYLVQIADTNCKPECIINLLCNVTCSLRPDLVNGFVRLEPCICKSHINLSFEVFKGSHATWSLCWPLYRSKFLVQYGMQMYKMYIFPSVLPNPVFIHTVTKIIFNREIREKSKALEESFEK